MRFLLGLVFFFLSFLGFSAPSGYLYFKKLTTQESQISVGTASLIGFPVLIRITDADLRSTANGGLVRSANGYDIIFTAADGNTLIPFQTEEYDATTGELVAWVKLPVLSAVVNTEFYIYFGNTATAVNLGTKSTWDANFKAVYHLNSDVADGTSNAANLTNTGTVNLSSGIAADGQRLPINSYLSRAATTGLQIIGDLTVETWMNFNTLISGSNENIVLSSSSNGGGSAFNTNYCLSVDGSGGSSGTLIFQWQYSNNSDESVTSSLPITTASGWHHIVVVRDVAAKVVRFYFDGQQLGVPKSFTNLPTGGASNSFLIGKNLEDASRTIDAGFDEVRISNIVRSPEWIQASYQSYKPASTFITYSPTYSVSAGSFCFCTINLSGFTSLGTFNGHTYFLSTQKTNWQKADSVASALGGHLVSITTAAENTFLTLSSLGVIPVWTGLSDSIAEGSFTWTSGESFSFSNWSLLQPDNFGNSDYVVFNSIALGLWDDQSNGPNQFVIEFDCIAPTVIVSDAGPDQGICGTSTTMAAAPIPATANGQWSIISGTGSFANPTSTTTAVSGLSQGTNVFLWKVGNGSCSPELDTVIIKVDNQAPNLICPSDILVPNSPGACTAIVNWTNPTFNDNCPGATIQQISGLANGSVFPAGLSKVAYRVTDSSGNFTECSFIVTVADTEVPKINCPSDLVVSNDPGFCGAIVNGIAPLAAADNCGPFVISYSINGATNVGGVNDASGEFFNTGLSQVTYKIIDSTGNSTTCTFNITVKDVTAPVFDFCPTDIAVNTDIGTCTANVSWALPLASDDCPGLTLTQTSGLPSGSAFPLGTNTIVYTATDAGGLSSICSFKVIVEDADPPTITCPPNQIVASEPGVCSATLLNIAPFSTNDNCSSTSILYDITGATILNGSGDASGNSFNPGSSLVTYTIKDSIGNNNTCSFSVDVTPVQPTSSDAGPNQVICGTSTILAANTPSSGTGLWTKVSGGGTISNPSSPNTTISGLTGGVSVFRWTISTSPCGISSSVVSVTITNPTTFADAGLDQTNLCGVTTTTLAANTPIAGVGAWSIVSGAGGSFTNAASPSSNFNGTIGTSYVLRWTISNPPCVANTDDVTITFNNQPSIANAGLDQTNLCGVTTTTLAANTPIAGVGAWSIVSGAGGNFSNAASPASTFNGTIGTSYVLRWTISNPPCVANTDDVTISFNNQPSIANAGLDQTNLCGVTTTTLAANTPIAGAGAWSIVSGAGGNFTNAASPTSNFNGTIGTSYVLRWTISNPPCVANTDDVTITFNNQPSIANAGLDQTNLCGVTTTTLAANTPIAGVGAWSIVSGAGGNFTNAASPNSTFNGTIGTSYVLRWSISNPPCVANTDDVTITFNNQPSIADAGLNQSICAFSTTLAANLPLSGTGSWSVVSGTGSFSNPGSPTSNVSGLSVGANVFEWKISTVCSSSTSNITITVSENPSTSNAGVNQLICSTSTTLNAATPLIGTGSWIKLSGTGTVVNPALANSTITGLSAGTSVFQWTVANGVCPSSISAISITVNSPPTLADAGLDQSICGNSATLTGNTALIGTGSWSVISGSGVFTQANSPLSQVSGLSNGANVLRWTIDNAPCTASFDEVTINVSSIPTSADAGLDQIALCGVTTCILSANAASGTSTGAWSIISGTGGNISIINSPTSSFTGLADSSYVLRWTLSSGGCADSFDDVVVKFNSLPSIANAGADFSICESQGTALLSASAPIAGNGSWTVIGGAANFSNPSINSPLISGFLVGNNIYRWSISSICGSSADTIIVHVDQVPSVATAGVDAIICSSAQPYSLNANNPLVGTGLWTVLSGSALVANSALFNTSVNNLSVGQNLLQWTTSNGICSSSIDTISIQVTPPPNAPFAGKDSTICSNTYTLQGNVAVNGIGNWSLISGSGIIANTSNENSSVNNLGIGPNKFVWTITSVGCAPGSDTVTITVNEPPSAAFAGNDETICSDSTQLNATVPAVGQGIWSLVAGAGTIVNASDPQSKVKALGIGANLFRWTLSNGVCSDSFDEVSIIVSSAPTIADAGIDDTICGNSYVLAANLPSIGSGFWTIASGSGSFVDPTIPNSLVNGLVQGINKFVWTISLSPCQESSDTISLLVTSVPSIANAGLDQLSFVQPE